VTARESALRFLRDEEAQGLVEYALILGIIAVAVIVSMVFFREQLMNIFSSIGNTVHDSPCQGQQQQGQCP
jgi:pilus assembly protein Flp/PilA